MGTLIGHALPGSFFLLFGLWRLIEIIRRKQLLRHYRQRKDDNFFYNTATYPCYAGWCSRWPLEGVVKVSLTSVGMAGELWASTDYGKAGKIVSIVDIQHVTMYSLFWLSGIIDLIVWCCHSSNAGHTTAGKCSCRRNCPGVPAGVDYIAMSLAFAGELLLFSQHTHGRAAIDKLVHRLLLYVLAATVLSVLAEWRYRHSLLAALTTVYLLIVQGSWFIQVGLLLYPPPDSWFEHLQRRVFNKLTDEEQTDWATMVFSWYLGGALLLVLTLYVVLQLLFSALCVCACARTADDAILEATIEDLSDDCSVDFGVDYL